MKKYKKLIMALLLATLWCFLAAASCGGGGGDDDDDDPDPVVTTNPSISIGAAYDYSSASIGSESTVLTKGTQYALAVVLDGGTNGIEYNQVAFDVKYTGSLDYLGFSSNLDKTVFSSDGSPSGKSSPVRFEAVASQTSNVSLEGDTSKTVCYLLFKPTSSGTVTFTLDTTAANSYVCQGYNVNVSNLTVDGNTKSFTVSAQ